MKRPFVVIVVACLYLVVGLLGFVFHFRELIAGHRDAIGIELTEFLAVVSGIGLLLRQNWARLLALAWVTFHVVLSFFHTRRELLVHAALCVLIAWALFRPATTRWFRQVS